MTSLEIRSPRAPVFGRRAMVVSGHSAADARRTLGLEARRHDRRWHDRRIGGARRGARPCHLVGRRLLHPLSRGGNGPHGRAQRLRHRARGGDTGGVSRRHEDPRPPRARRAGAGARLGGDASPLWQALLARAVRGFARSRRERPSRLARARRPHSGGSRLARGRSGLRRALSAERAAGRAGRSVPPAGAGAHACAASPPTAPTVSIAARPRAASAPISPSAAA